jgi:hypothetical protein
LIGAALFTILTILLWFVPVRWIELLVPEED